MLNGPNEKWLDICRCAFVKWVSEAKAVQTVAPCRISSWAAAHMGVAVGIAFGISVVLTVIISFMVYAFAFHRVRRYREKVRLEKEQAAAAANTSSNTPQRLSDSVRLQLWGGGATAMVMGDKQFDTPIKRTAFSTVEKRVTAGWHLRHLVVVTQCAATVFFPYVAGH